MRKFFYYLPRILTIGVVIFLYLFVLEAFSPGFDWQSGLMHFILATIVLLFGVLAWKKPKIGGWLFFIPSLISVLFAQWLLLGVTSILALIGMLYLIEGYGGRKK